MSEKDYYEEEYCYLCRRPESIAGKMFHLPNNIGICQDCMQKTMDTMGQLDYSDMMKGFPGMMQGNMPENTPKADEKPVEGTVEDTVEDIEKDTKEDKEDESGEEQKKQGIPGMPNIQFINWADLQGMMPGTPKIKKKKPKTKRAEAVLNINDIPKPHKIKESLDDYIIGQEHAKKVISVAVYNHYKRIMSENPEKEENQENTSPFDQIEIEKSNMLMIGPTGCGKTYLVKTLAKLLDVPLALADATSLTEAGYIGDDIESVVSKLLAEADNDVERAEHGIIFIDEIDKIAKKKNTSSRDVSGESVQQGMLKLLEGSDVEVPVGANSKNAMVPLTTVNTRNILFICGGAFPDLDEIIKQRLSKNSSMGFNADLKDSFDKDKKILEKVTVEDIRKFGMIPEFIGRLPIIFTLEGLSEDMLVRVLKEPRNAILKQYEKLLALDEVQLEFTDGALCAIAQKALEKETGARALRAIIEEFMLDIMYEIPKDDNIGRVTITQEYIEGKGGPMIDMRGVKELEQK